MEVCLYMQLVQLRLAGVQKHVHVCVQTYIMHYDHMLHIAEVPSEGVFVALRI